MRMPCICAAVVALIPTLSVVLLADDSAAIQQKLVATYAVTQPTADLSDIVTAGAVLVLKQGNIVMAPTSKTDMCQNAYKNGRISQNGVCKASGWLSKAKTLPGMGGVGPDSPQTRTFVAGEKMWVTGIKVQPDGAVFNLFTDAISDVRYKAALTFKFGKGGAPSSEEVEKMVGEVFKVQESDDDKKSAEQQPQQQQPAEQGGGAGAKVLPVSQNTPAANTAAPAQAAAPAPLAPPPPPPADPKTIGLGQTPEEVTSALGQPDKIVKLGSKQIYIYKDMKVTFTGGKVSDVK